MSIVHFLRPQKSYYILVMALTKVQKQKIVEELKEKIERQKSIVFVDFSGVGVKDLSKLRKKMKGADCELKVAKKTLISLALKGKKVEIDFKKLEGEIALGFGYKDEILPFKIFYDFSKANENLKIIGGLIGREFLEKEKAVELAKLPSKEELLAQLFFTTKFSIFGLYNHLQRNLSILAQLQKVQT